MTAERVDKCVIWLDGFDNLLLLVLEFQIRQTTKVVSSYVSE